MRDTGGLVRGRSTPDGCAVELYARLPVGNEPDVIAAAVPAGAHILELGCGVGRVTHPLLDRGFAVTAVDESPEMLERVRGARTVCGPIEHLDLGETFESCCSRRSSWTRWRRRAWGWTPT